MTEQTIKKQVAREYYNVLYSAKLHFASFDICEKLPTIISGISLSFGVIGLAFAELNSKALASLLLIIGIIGIILKPRELQKERYEATGINLTDISKKLEHIYCEVNGQDTASVTKARADLAQLQAEHRAVDTMSPVLMSSLYAHYKVFSEHNSGWMIAELGLGWRDKVPLGLRLTVIGGLLATLLWVNPLCVTSKTWAWVSEPCVGCWQEQPEPNLDREPTK
ncbi:SLATT domain-containing protein [Shewanella frigidimarina]|uniref:SLATT domain-containing protein n=1 Tax=Shewanella frigidimarina TaxID=56812 RepID=UPI000F4E3079|nr:SLATT domain-containing protein [Shewanella frigidimarina]RPA22900.1 SLATT domain-containing protein [Shewanella frigidimarina]